MQAVHAVQHIESEASTRFIGRDEAIHALAIAMVSGHHAIMLGEPGTGKSALARFFSEASGLIFYRKLLNQDTTRDELVGPIDPVQLQQGKWDRNWQGLAECDVAFLDEIGKAGSQVQNMLLDALEERKVTGSADRDIPLHMVVSASNEEIDGESPALWDRFTLRIVVRGVDSGKSLFGLLSSARNRSKPYTSPITREELVEMREEVKRRAESASETVLNAVVQMWSRFDQITTQKPSDRRWLRLLEVAAAESMLDDADQIEVRHLRVAPLVLWENQRDIEDIREMVLEISDQEGQKMRSLQSAAEELLNTTVDSLEQAAKLNLRVSKLIRHIHSEGMDAEDLVKRLTDFQVVLEDF
jgi:MoxR-like ATPase